MLMPFRTGGAIVAPATKRGHTVKARRLISVLILVAFVPAAVGCSRSRTIQVEDDPSDSGTATRFRAGEVVEVRGYTRPDDGFRRWKGFVQTMSADSLAFESKAARKAPSISFDLARDDVTSIDAREFSPWRTAGLSLGLVVLAGLVVGGLYLAMNPIDLGGSYYP
jgi:hypothetical protein